MERALPCPIEIPFEDHWDSLTECNYRSYDGVYFEHNFPVPSPASKLCDIRLTVTREIERSTYFRLYSNGFYEKLFHARNTFEGFALPTATRKNIFAYYHWSYVFRRGKVHLQSIRTLQWSQAIAYIYTNFQ